MSDRLHIFLDRAERLLERLEPLLPPAPTETDWRAHAFRWRRRGHTGWPQPPAHPPQPRLPAPA